MDKHTYFTRFSRVVRWRLSKTDAEEVLSDYKELLAHRPDGNDDTLLRELGAPETAAALLTDSRAYRRWLAAFGAMAACLLVPFLLLLRTGFRSEPTILMWALFLLGAAVSFVWFRPRSHEKKAPRPKGLLPGLGLLLLLLVCSGVLLGGLAFGVWESIPARLYGTAARWVLWLAGSAAAAAGVCALIKARTADRRWRALYVLGLTVLIECVLVLSLLTDLDISISAPDWWVDYVVRWSVLDVAGLAATGVSLC